MILMNLMKNIVYSVESNIQALRLRAPKQEKTRRPVIGAREILAFSLYLPSQYALSQHGKVGVGTTTNSIIVIIGRYIRSVFSLFVLSWPFFVHVFQEDVFSKLAVAVSQ